MKIKKIFITAILLQLFAVSYFAQEVESIMIDSFSYANREDMMARIYNFTVELQNKPTAKGYIITKGSKSSRSFAEKDIKSYLKMRAFDMKNVVFLNGEGEKTAEVEFWLVPPGAKPPAQEQSVSQNTSVETQIIALEKAAWNAWKNKDVAFFQTLLVDDAISVNSGGVFDKPQILEYYGSCDVKSYSLDDFKFRMLDKNSALITFTATQDAVCGGEKNPSTVRASSVYVKRGGKWLNSFYTETAAAPDNSLVETQIIALEKASWEAFKNKNGSWFQNNLADDYTFVSSGGVLNKSQIVEATVSQCDVKSYSLDNFKVEMLTKDSALVTYTAMQNTVCNGNAFPNKATSAAVYVMRSGKWLSALHMQSAAAQ